MAERYVGRYNFDDIFGDKEGKRDYKPSYLRDITRVHFYNNDDENRKTFISEREDQYEGFFSRNFQHQIEARTRQLGYEDRERITREAVFEQANYNYTNSVLNNTGSVFNRLFTSFQTPDLFENSDQSAMFGREVLHEFTNYLKQPAHIRENSANTIPLPAKELDFKFEQSIQRSVNSAKDASRHITNDINDFQRRNASSPSQIDYWTGGGITRGKRLLDNVDYINRPGILPAIGMLHDADSEFSINIYQLQNKPIIDYYTANLKSRAEQIRDERAKNNVVSNFKFNVMLAWNEELAQNEDSLKILGPNIVALRTFQALQKQYGDAIDFNIQTNDKRNHTKLLFSDTGAYISTQNQTAPVGKSLYQAGSNYETGRYVRNLDINSEDIKERAEGKIYQQIAQIHNRMFSEKRILSTNLPNVGAALETYEMIKTSLKFLHNNQNRNIKADFILDQVFLLQHQDSLYAKVTEGEMGPEDKKLLSRLEGQHSYREKIRRYREELQEPLLRALIENKASVTVDPRNYKENVLEPIFSSLMKDQSYIDTGYNLTKFLNVDSRLDTEGKIAQVMRNRGLSRSSAVQLLAIESGNIQPANVPREHVKAAAFYELVNSPNNRSFEYNGLIYSPLGASTNSSNMGVGSTAISINEETVNNELGLYHLAPEVRATSDVFKAHNMNMSYVLNESEEILELVDHTKNILNMKSDLSSRRVSQLQYTDVNNRAEYERSTDRAKLRELFDHLDAMNKASGNLMTVGFDFDNQGPIAVKVEINAQLKYKFTYGQGFISEVNKSLVIGNSEFVNQSGSNINLGFKDEAGNFLTVGVGKRETLSPIQTTMSMISSIALESEQIRLIRAPLIEYRENYAPGLEGNTSFDTGMARYLLNLSGYGDKLTNDVLHKGRIDETSIVIGALTNLQARMKNADPTLDKVRQLAGIDINNQSRIANIEYLNKLIDVFARVDSKDRHAVLTGEGLPAGTPNLKSFMSSLFQSPEYADLLYDFINSQGDPLYRQSVTDYIKEVSTRVYDPYLSRTQVSNYGSTQAYRQRPLYGVTKRRQGFADSINRASAETVQNLTRLGAYALAASPFEHDATSDLGRGSSLLYMPITGTGGSREKSGLEYSGYHNYGALHPYFQHKKIGTVTALDIIQDAGVGSILTRQGIADYNESIKHLGLDPINPDDILGKDQDTKLLFNFDVKKKASQIPQRINNVIGSRPTRELSEVYQNLIEGNKATYRGIGGNFNQQVNSIEQLRSLYLSDLRSRVGDKAGLIDDSYAVGIEEAGQIRATLSSDLAAVLESVREDINNEFGDTVDDETKREILRVRLLQADQSAHAMRGFIGSSRRGNKDSVVLFQLSGAYSDYSILNPYFGGENGMRTTFTDRAVKGQKSSQISSQRLLEGVNEDFNVANEILVKSGEFVKLNQETGLFHIYSFDNESGQYKPGQVISNRKEGVLVNNLIEAVSVNPTLGSLRFTSNAASFEGVDAIEIFRDVRILEGGVDSNEIRIELNYNRTQKGGSGGRQESLSGGLAKMVPIYLDDPHKDGKRTGVDGLVRQMFTQFNRERAGSFAGNGRELDFHQFYGVVNPSNLKSYFYEHGAKILIDQSKRNALLGSDAKHLAASLLMAFGTSKFGESHLNAEALDALGKAAASEELGTFYKDQFIYNFIKKKGNISEVNKQFVAGLPKDAITGINNISSIQVRTLQYIGLDLITDVLNGNTAREADLIAKLKKLLTDDGISVKLGEYIDIGKDRGRELSIIAASIDYFVQLTKATPHDIAVFDATKDSVAYRSLGTIGGLTYEELKKEEERDLVNQLGRRSYVVGMNMSMSASQSKVAISSKLDSFIENQHIIWEPFYTDAKKFKGGSLSALRHLMAGFFGAITGTHTGEFQNSVTNLRQLDILSPQVRGSVFKASMLGVYNDPGVGDTQFKELQRNYEMFETLASIADTRDAALIREIIKVYRKNSESLDVEPGQLNKHLESIIEAADAENIGKLNQLVEQGRDYAFNHFERMYADFRLDPNHRTNAGQAISSGLQRSAGNMGRFAFSFPHLEFTDDGSIKVYKDSHQYSFSLAGEDMKIIGESFGNVDNPLQKSQAILWKAMAPGSAVSRFFDRIADSNDPNRIINVNDLSEEDYNEIAKFYTTATLMPDELTQALGVFANKTMGGSRVGFAGGTTTPAAWFMGSTTATILPEAILARHGGGDSNRMRVHQGLVNQYKNLGEVSNEADTLNQSKKVLLTSAINTLNRGISGEATAELNSLLKRSLEFKARIEAAGSNKDQLLSIIDDIEGMNPESKQTIGYYRKHLNIRTVEDKDGNKKVRMGANVRDGGDSFVHLLGLYELRALRAMALEQGGIEGIHRGIETSELIEQANTYKSLISPIDGLLVGINNREGSIYVTPEELIGQMRRGADKLENSIGLTHKHIAGLEGEAGFKYLNTILDGINNFARQEEARLNIKYKDTNAAALIKGTLDQLNDMRSTFDKYRGKINESMTKYDVADLALLIQTDVEIYHVELMLNSDQAMRPMPMGNPYSGRAIYDVFGLTNLNNLMSEYGLPISFTPPDGTNNRNKTLHLFNPYSWLVAHGGDFDGDMITNMFRTTNQMKLKANSYDALIEKIESEITTLSNSKNMEGIAGNQDKEDEVQSKIDKLTNRIQNLDRQRKDLRTTITNISNHESVTEYQKAAANWVGNYLKVDSRVFLGKELGGFRNKGDTLPPEVLFTFTEQGRGLFGGMEGIVSSTKDLFNDLTTIANRTDRFNNLDNIQDKLNDISDTSGLRQLLSDPNLRPEFVSDLQARIKEAGDVQGGIAVHIANLYAAQAGAEQIQKYNLKGIDGASMTPAIFEAMEHTLGQAGSVILGKSYNTMVGMLYTEAPTLTMSYAVLNDPDHKLENLVKQSYGGGVTGDKAWIDLVEAAKQSRAKSEGTMSFLQSTQQILRDAIKPKDAVDYLGKLEDIDKAIENYRNADGEEGRSLAYKSIVEKFGPGPGLKALIEMESLVLDGNILNYRGDSESELSMQKQTLDRYELTEQRMAELEQRLGYDSRNGTYTKLSEKVNKQIRENQLTKEYVLAAYKTKQDMVSVVSDFAFDKGLNLGGSTGASMLDAFNQGKTELESWNRIQELTIQSEEYVSSTDKAAYLAGLDAESQAFIEALTHRGLGKLEGLTEGEQKFNNLWGKDLDTSKDKREYAAHTWMETNKQFGYTVGEYGEMFIRFGAFNQARRKAYASNPNLRETYYGLDDPLAVAQMMAMTNDKVEPSLIGNLFNSLANAARHQTGNANPSIEEIYRGIAFGAGLNESDSDVTMRTILQGGEAEASQKVTEHLVGIASSMSTGQQTASVKDFLNSSQKQYVQALSEEVLTRHYVEKGFSPEEAATLASNSMNTYKTSTGTTSGGTITEATFTRPVRNNNIGRALNSLGKDADVKAQGFIFPMLGLIGAALSTGDLTPEAFQMAAGTALQNMAYVRWSNLEQNYAGTAANIMAGTAFKMRLALEESEGDAGKALVAATTRELTMAATAMTVNSVLPKHIDRMLGGGETLDFDKYQSGRTLVTSTVSAIASTMLGMLLNNQVINRMVSPEASYVTKELNAINHQNKITFHTNQEESEESIPVEGDDGILDYKVFQTWANEDTDDYQISIMNVSEAVNFTFYNPPNTVYEFQLDK